jgi:hypothetical protein
LKVELRHRTAEERDARAEQHWDDGNLQRSAASMSFGAP